ncbi:hypothetical protein B0H21DRAFT_823036 [Amylocystis lapponica]|nr:hypothetical protein B0H21DRAFT_823036 [Amylocystis lapponica]
MEIEHSLVQIGWDDFMSNLTAGGDPTPEERAQFMDFSCVKLDGTEAQIYAPFCNTAKSVLDVLTEKDLVMKNTADWPDPRWSGCDGEDSDLRPDIGIYPTADAALAEYELTKEKLLASKKNVPEARRHLMARVSWNWLCVPFEFKRGDDNVPFEFGHPDPKRFLKEMQDGETAQEQIAEYVAQLLLRQHRVFTFKVYVVGPHTRLMRWDRAGAIITESFNYVECPDKMRTFIYRLGKMNNIQRGHDPTVILASTDDAGEMRTCGGDLSKLSSTRRKYLAEATKVGWPFYEIKLHPGGFRGRSGCCEDEVLVPYTKKLVFLKDSWRSDDSEHIPPERKTYQRLHAKGVRFIATLICAGDVGVPARRTRTQEFASEIVLDARVHYRLVVKQVGRPLEDYEHSREMVTVVRDVFQAHEDAWLKAEVLHGDVSPGNILIDDDAKAGDYCIIKDPRRPVGFLNDWYLCKYKEDLTKGATQRSGTWQIMSALLLRYPGKPSALSDDLEVFVHTLTWLSLKYHSIRQDDRGFLELHVYSIYEFWMINTHGDYIGSLQKLHLMQNGMRMYPLVDEQSLEHLLGKLMACCASHYATVDLDELERNTQPSSDPPLAPSLIFKPNAQYEAEFGPRKASPAPWVVPLPEPAPLLSNHNHFAAAFREVLTRDWFFSPKLDNQFASFHRQKSKGLLSSYTFIGSKRKAEELCR